MKTFMVIWFGQFISMLGSALSAFGLGIWIFQKTGSAASFAMSAVCTVLPALLFAPFAGSIADRKKRKAIILLTDSIDAFLKILIVTLLIFNKLELWMVYPLVFISGTLGAFQNPAFGASIPMLVPSDKLTRANGLLQFSSAIQNLLAPVIAGFLYPLIELKGLFIIDFVSFFFALASIAFIKIPQPSIEKTKDSLVLAAFKDLQYAWKYLIQKEGLMQLIVFFAFLNFIANLSMILLGPLMMSVYNSQAYGNVQAGIGLAMLLGGLCSSLIPDTKNKIKRILLILSLCSIGPIISGTTLNRIIITGGFFIFMFPVPYVNTLLMSIFQIKIERNVLGRVGALMTAILAAITPIAYLCAGPLADYVFEPLMNEKGRGIGLIFIISGILLIISCLLMRLNKTVTSIEKRLPDYVDNQ
ncbi:MFS transporter [Treponema denticola]|jgi:macrolide efflux protein, putative|uniref:MFS transporter n=1 Tax=Treponema denticola TaxID=158 RepID=A0A9Q9EW79_TREDN|nr:MFS transporter [Treponema denticola]UTC91396.1 MFS transporter [Treponema denticola]UTC99250.1 MFS transporter [Treponema denticola]